MIVVDVNLLLASVLKTPPHDLVRRLHKTDRSWVVPRLWRAEFLNGLVSLRRARIIDAGTADRAWRTADKQFGDSEQEPNGSLVLTLSARYGISAYDAHYVALAQELGVPLVTNDVKSLASKCPESLVVRLTSFV